jgi:hypothetical protein
VLLLFSPSSFSSLLFFTHPSTSGSRSTVLQRLTHLSQVLLAYFRLSWSHPLGQVCRSNPQASSIFIPSLPLSLFPSFILHHFAIVLHWADHIVFLHTLYPLLHCVLTITLCLATTLCLAITLCLSIALIQYHCSGISIDLFSSNVVQNLLFLIHLCTALSML